MSEVTGDNTTIVEHYEDAGEHTRLQRGIGQLEFARTCDIIRRYAPAPPAVVLDVGGGAGIYAFWLSNLGYEMHLIDLVPKHCEQARQVNTQSRHPLASISIGDARALERVNTSADVVLLLGPLYHLTSKADRLLALREAARVLRPGGLVFAAVISRFASAMDGIFSRYITDPDFRSIVDQDLTTGQHRNPTQHPGYFTTAYFHHPMELQDEIMQAGLVHECTLAVEGVGCLLRDFDTLWQDAEYRNHLMITIRHLETEPSMLGVTSHLVGIGRK